MTPLEQLYVHVARGVGEAPPPFPITNRPEDEIKISHIWLLIRLTLSGIGATIEPNGDITLPRPRRRKTRRKRRSR